MEIKFLAVIAEVTADSETGLRFVRDEAIPGGWRADLLINYRTETVSQPPACFKPTEEVIEALNSAYFDHVMQERFKIG
jgi:hypothetical protein